MKLLVVVLLVLAGAGAFAVRGASFSAPPETARVPASAPAQPAAAAEATAPPAAAGETTVEVTEAQLTEGLNRAIGGKPIGETPLGPATAERFEVRLRDGKVETTGSAVVAGASVPLSLLGTVEARDGRPLARVSEAKVANVPLPEPARAEVERSLQAQLDQALGAERLRLTSVRVSNGVLTLSGAPR